jgi:hypothetical protein
VVGAPSVHLHKHCANYPEKKIEEQRKARESMHSKLSPRSGEVRSADDAELQIVAVERGTILLI